MNVFVMEINPLFYLALTKYMQKYHRRLFHSIQSSVATSLYIFYEILMVPGTLCVLKRSLW